ncbi:MAG: helix-turn-helix domain-containing protein [Melioribacteraceae bacterium]|nr:helix-turn-helix domain-containing protein [Melioribacteraceae bacterium]MCF8353913.1 helix-turn-helix domain-containing protein [Melioribacteraceae bacterium]MCF8392670.1 helix-turn-helix domain-containing protein [Melioribacteraceae bacterium]MCF8417691.1 helix-turn-helix domain-containing protein [Melioribacteraceae bacterium]
MTQSDEVLKKLHKIEHLLEERKNIPLNLVQAAEYLSISQSHLYRLTSKRKIPCHKPNGKYLYFFKDELDEWIVNNNRINSPHPDTISTQKNAEQATSEGNASTPLSTEDEEDEEPP